MFCNFDYKFGRNKWKKFRVCISEKWAVSQVAVYFQEQPNEQTLRFRRIIYWNNQPYHLLFYFRNRMEFMPIVRFYSLSIECSLDWPVDPITTDILVLCLKTR